MDDIIEHWERLQYAIKSVENASVSSLTDRVKDMRFERKIFNKLLTGYYRKTFPIGDEA